MTDQPESVRRGIYEDPEQLITESLIGLERAFPDLLRFDHENQIVVSRTAPAPGRVGVISGGGSGHEPLHAGYVGVGMLDAACPGQVFTSPVPDQILAATLAVDGGAGVLHVVKNYQGDVLSFRIAAEDAADEGVETAVVLVADDVSLEDESAGTGRRGVGATVFVEKVAGAAAARGLPLAEVARLAQHASDSSRSFGLGLSSCTPPTSTKPFFNLPVGRMEVGVGMHGERGRERRLLGSSSEVAGLLVDAVLADVDQAEGDLLVLVNGFGGTTQMELLALSTHIDSALEERGFRATRRLVGNHVTALDMAGVSLSVLALDDELLELWDAPVLTPALQSR